jgi:5-methylcytosine-specific restriction endonuclease McrA
MPHSSPRSCRVCRTTLVRTRDGVCPLCRTAAHRRYGSARYADPARDDRYYRTAAWRKLRAAKLGRQPLCERCLGNGAVTPAYGVNHIVARKQGGPDAIENLESLCKGHLTAADVRGAIARRRPPLETVL